VAIFLKLESPIARSVIHWIGQVSLRAHFPLTSNNNYFSQFSIQSRESIKFFFHSLVVAVLTPHLEKQYYFHCRTIQTHGGAFTTSQAVNYIFATLLFFCIYYKTIPHKHWFLFQKKWLVVRLVSIIQLEHQWHPIVDMGSLTWCYFFLFASVDYCSFRNELIWAKKKNE
jgi:hypothetical protein